MGSLQIIVTAAFALAVTMALAIAPTVNGARCLNVEIASSLEKFDMLKTFAVTYTRSKPFGRRLLRERRRETGEFR